jgi:hypothetical protein
MLPRTSAPCSQSARAVKCVQTILAHYCLPPRARHRAPCQRGTPLSLRFVELGLRPLERAFCGNRHLSFPRWGCNASPKQFRRLLSRRGIWEWGKPFQRNFAAQQFGRPKLRKGRHSVMSDARPHYLRKRTSARSIGMSALCQKQLWRAYSITTSAQRILSASPTAAP